jgi:hypothetical protein
MITFNLHRNPVWGLATRAICFLLVLNLGVLANILAQSIDDGAPVITSQPQWCCRPQWGPGAIIVKYDVTAVGFCLCITSGILVSTQFLTLQMRLTMGRLGRDRVTTSFGLTVSR